MGRYSDNVNCNHDNLSKDICKGYDIVGRYEYCLCLDCGEEIVIGGDGE